MSGLYLFNFIWNKWTKNTTNNSNQCRTRESTKDDSRLKSRNSTSTHQANQVSVSSSTIRPVPRMFKSLPWLVNHRAHRRSQISSHRKVFKFSQLLRILNVQVAYRKTRAKMQNPISTNMSIRLWLQTSIRMIKNLAALSTRTTLGINSTKSSITSYLLRITWLSKIKLRNNLSQSRCKTW